MLRKIPRWARVAIVVLGLLIFGVVAFVVSGSAPSRYSFEKVDPALKTLPVNAESVIAGSYMDGGSWAFRFKDSVGGEYFCCIPFGRDKRGVVSSPVRGREDFPKLVMGAKKPGDSGTVVILDEDNLAYFCERVRSSKSFPSPSPDYPPETVLFGLDQISESGRYRQAKLTLNDPAEGWRTLSSEVQGYWRNFEYWLAK